MPWVPDITAYCAKNKAAKPDPECFMYWCYLPAQNNNDDCADLTDYCSGNDNKNWDLPECTAPCDIQANMKDKRCQAAARR